MNTDKLDALRKAVQEWGGTYVASGILPSEHTFFIDAIFDDELVRCGYQRQSIFVLCDNGFTADKVYQYMNYNNHKFLGDR